MSPKVGYDMPKPEDGWMRPRGWKIPSPDLSPAAASSWGVMAWSPPKLGEMDGCQGRLLSRDEQR